MLEMFNESRFMTQKKVREEFEEEDKLTTMAKFRLKRFKPSQRIYEMNKLDSFNLILDGKVGIFIEDHQKTKKLEISSLQSRDYGITFLDEVEAEERRERKRQNSLRKRQQVKQMLEGS